MKFILSFALLAAVILGGWRIVDNRLERERAATAETQAARTAQIERLRQDKARLRTELAAKLQESTAVASAQPPPPVAPQSAGARASSQYLAKLIADGTVKLGSNMSASDALVPTTTGAFPPGFGKLFGLDDAAIAKLHEDMIAIKNRVDALIAARSAVTRPGNGCVVITYPPLPEGEALREELRTLLVGAIGQEGFAVYLALRPENARTGGGGINDFYSAFGVNGATWTLSKQTGNPDPNKAELYEFKRVGVDPIRTTGTVSTAGNNTPRSRLETYLGPQAALLPADF